MNFLELLGKTIVMNQDKIKEAVTDYIQENGYRYEHFRFELLNDRHMRNLSERL